MLMKLPRGVVRSPVRTKKKPRCNDWTVRADLFGTLDWKRRYCRVRMKHRMKASGKRKKTRRCGDISSVFIKMLEWEQDERDPDEFVLGEECPSDSDLEETLTDASAMILQSQSPERTTAETSSRVKDESIKNQNCNNLETAGGGRARLSVAHTDVPFSIL